MVREIIQQLESLNFKLSCGKITFASYNLETQKLKEKLQKQFDRYEEK